MRRFFIDFSLRLEYYALIYSNFCIKNIILIKSINDPFLTIMFPEQKIELTKHKISIVSKVK